MLVRKLIHTRSYQLQDYLTKFIKKRYAFNSYRRFLRKLNILSISRTVESTKKHNSPPLLYFLNKAENFVKHDLTHKKFIKKFRKRFKRFSKFIEPIKEIAKLHKILKFFKLRKNKSSKKSKVAKFDKRKYNMTLNLAKAVTRLRENIVKTRASNKTQYKKKKKLGYKPKYKLDRLSTLKQSFQYRCHYDLLISETNTPQLFFKSKDYLSLLNVKILVQKSCSFFSQHLDTLTSESYTRSALFSFEKLKSCVLQPLPSLGKKFYNLNLLTKHKYPYILHNIGLILPLKFMYKKKSLPIFQIKKKLFSFLKINELKMSVFKIKRNLLLSKMFFLLVRNHKTTKLYKLKNKSIYSYFKNFNNVFRGDLNNNSYSKLNISDDLFKKGMTLKPFEANDQRTFGRELRIPRVKFKPGYQRL